MRELYARLKERCALGELTQQRPNLGFVTLPREHLRQALTHLRDSEGYTHLVLLTAVDWLEDGQFQLTYLLSHRTQGSDFGLRVLIPRLDAEMDSVHDLWPTAATYQRELREMFGIQFPGSPGVNDDFILEGWIGMPPYRRDFDTKKFSEENYNHRPGRETRDPTTYMKQQLYPGGL